MITERSKVKEYLYIFADGSALFSLKQVFVIIVNNSMCSLSARIKT